MRTENALTIWRGRICITTPTRLERHFARTALHDVDGGHFAFCLTSKMSHAHGRHDSCRLRLLSPRFHSIRLSLARGMTDVGVGSGALLGLLNLATAAMGNIAASRSKSLRRSSSSRKQRPNVP